jgi:hypothetical protein
MARSLVTAQALWNAGRSFQAPRREREICRVEAERSGGEDREIALSFQRRLTRCPRAA